MGLEIIKKLNVDFHDAKYIHINAKQHDRSSRFIEVTCYNQGDIFLVDGASNSAYIRYNKPDEHGVFNKCEITNEGKILVELSEQMLAVVGKCIADLVVVHNDPSGSVTIDANTGELIIGDNSSILSTMIFCVNVVETSFDNTEIESSYEYNAFNDLMVKVTADYTSVINACKASEENAKESELNASASEINAKTSEESAKESELNAKMSEDIATTKAEESAQSASDAARSATESAENARISVDKATESSDYATLSKSYAVGGTDTRENEDADNSQYYYLQTKAISDSIDGSFVPMGTIKFEELGSAAKETGYVYHISDSFVTDDTFKCGAGISYPSGTNVYCTSDGYWDCFISKELTGDLKVTDDDAGNVTILFTPNDTKISYEDYNALKQTIERLQEQIKTLEEQTALEITE